MGNRAFCAQPAAHGLQGMMQRWEQLHPVNAMQIAWLQKNVDVSVVLRAADLVFARLAASFGCPASGCQTSSRNYDFEHRPFVGDWRAMLESAVTNELNRPYSDDAPPWRLVLFESSRDGQFLTLGYRHLIADARSVALILHEIIRSIANPSAACAAESVAVRADSLHSMFPNEFRLRCLPGLVRHHLSEIWASGRTFRQPCDNPAELTMAFRVHATDLSLNELKVISRCHGATINDLICASMLEWFARRFPPNVRGRRRQLAVAVLADLTCRAAPRFRRAFGQYLSQYAVRAPVTPEMPFAEVVRHVASSSRKSKQITRLIQSVRGFSLIARAWDLIPIVRRPAVLPVLIPLLGGISNVHLSAITEDAGLERMIRGYFRGTCVANLLPMMLCVTTLDNVCSITTTHRTARFDDHDMHDLVAHVTRRLGSARAAAAA